MLWRGRRDDETETDKESDPSAARGNLGRRSRSAGACIQGRPDRQLEARSWARLPPYARRSTGRVRRDHEAVKLSREVEQGRLLISPAGPAPLPGRPLGTSEGGLRPPSEATPRESVAPAEPALERAITSREVFSDTLLDLRDLRAGCLLDGRPTGSELGPRQDIRLRRQFWAGRVLFVRP